MVTRRGLLGGLLAGAALPVLPVLAVPALADGPARLLRPRARPLGHGAAAGRPDAGALIAAAGLGGVTAFAVADARTGAVLEAHEAEAALPPASTAKAITALFALERLGAGHRFVTQVLVTGPVAGGVVQGDLVLAGSGDPVLDTDSLGDLAAALRKAGVTAVTGAFLVWDGALPRIARIAADQPEHVGYNPAIAGLNLNYNRVHFEWARGQAGWGVAMDARGSRFVPPVRMARMTVVDRAAPLFTYRARGATEDWTVASAALGAGGSRWLPVRQPALYAGEVFQTLAAAQGTVLPAPRIVGALPAGQVVARHVGAPLPDILRGMLRHSTNLTAEVLGLAATGAGGLAASGGGMSDWARGRLGADLRFVDHSGLGARSRVSAAQFVRALVAAQALPDGAGLKAVLRDLGMKDDEGGAIDSPVRVVGKTGTLNFVSALVGYIQPPSGRELAFAILSADTARRDRLTEAERERPQGGKAWAGRARRLQGQLIARWVGMHP